VSANQVAAYHRQIVARLRSVLGGELVGVYAGGSFALNGYTPGRSDIDVAAVSRGHLPQALKEEIIAALRHEALPCPARGIEFVLYPEQVVRRPTGEAGFELDLNSGATMPFHLSFDPSEVPRHWYVIDRAILSEYGKCLAGPPAQQLFAPIPRETILPTLAEAVRWHEARGVARDDDAVLNACRAWRYALQSTWCAKQEAGTWTLAQLDDPSLVISALAARTGDGRLPRREVESFLRRIVQCLEGASQATP
jgi:hypothetical protein